MYRLCVFCLCEAGDRYLAFRWFNIFTKKILDLYSRAILWSSEDWHYSLEYIKKFILSLLHLSTWNCFLKFFFFISTVRISENNGMRLRKNKFRLSKLMVRKYPELPVGEDKALSFKWFRTWKFTSEKKSFTGQRIMQTGGYWLLKFLSEDDYVICMIDYHSIGLLLIATLQ